MARMFHQNPTVPALASGICDAAIERLLRDPAWPASVHDFLARTIAMYEANPVLNRILSDRGRTVVSLFALYLHHIPPPGEAEAGLTVGRMQALCRQTGLCSNGRASAMVSVLRFGGYLAPGMRDGDRRRRVLVPTALFLREQKQRWSMQFEAMIPLFVSAPSILAAIEDTAFTTAFTTAFLRRLGASYFGGFRLIRQVPVLAELIESNAALLMLGVLLLRAGPEKLEPAGRPVAIATAGLARRFGVARAHVRTLLIEAEHARLIDRDTETGRVVVLPALAAAVESFFAAAFLLFALCGEQALHDIGLQPELPRRACR